MTKQRRAQRPNNFSMWAAKGGGRREKKRFASLFWLSKKQLPEKVNSYTKQPHFLIYLFTYLDEQEEQ